MADKLTPCTHENQLKPGVLVELRGCKWCGATHRVLLVRPLGEFDYREGPAEGWSVAPQFACNSYPPNFRSAIPERRLFIVDTGLDEKQDIIESALLEHAARKIKLDIR